MRRLLLILLSIVLSLTFVGCEARSSVDIDVSSNGSGSVDVKVVLDKEASALVPNLKDQLQTKDLVENGWTIGEPSTDDDGNTEITASHAFGSISEGNQVLADLSNGGPLKGFVIHQEKGILSSRTSFTGQIDLSKGVESFGDQTMQQRFGSPIGIDVNELQRSLGLDLSKSFPIEISVDLPGEDKASPVTNSGKWTSNYGAVTTLSANASGLNVMTILFMALTAICAFCVFAIVVFWKSETYKPKHRRKIVGSGVRARDLVRQA